jgi:hypothetical protein
MHWCICFLALGVLVQAVPYPSWVELSSLTLRWVRFALVCAFLFHSGRGPSFGYRLYMIDVYYT